MTVIRRLGVLPSAVATAPCTSAGGLPRWIYVPAALGAAFVVLPLVAIAVEGRLAAVLVADHQRARRVTAL